MNQMLEASDGVVAKSRPASRVLRSIRTALLVLFFAVPAAGGLLSLLEVLRDGVGGVEGLGGAVGVAVSADGRHVYATGRSDNALAVFARNATRNTLTFVEVHEDGVGGVFGLAGASAVTVSPDGRHVYVASSIDDALAVFARDASGNSLDFVNLVQNGKGGVFGLDGASAVAVSPDGRLVFVTGAVDDALAVFTRDASNDALTFVDLEQNNVNATGLAGASSVTTSPDGELIFVTGALDDALAVFARDASPDGVSFLTELRDGVGGVEGLAGASSVAASPDGNFVYATGREDNALAIFVRDASPDTLTFLTHLRDGTGGIDGLAGAASVALNPAGDLTFVAGQAEDSVAAFHRTEESGLLRLATVITDGVDGIDGLAGVAALVVSPDGRHLYVVAEDDSSISGFRIVELIFEDDFESGNTGFWSFASR